MYDHEKSPGREEPSDEHFYSRDPVPLLSIAFRVDLIEGPARGATGWRSEYRGDGDRLDPEDFVHQSRARWESEILQEVKDRLQLTTYGRFIIPVIRTNHGSIFTSLTFLLVGGVSVVKFLHDYKDFYESSSLIIEHSRRIVNKAIQYLLMAEGPTYQDVDVTVQVDDFATFQVQDQDQARPPADNPPPPPPSPPPAPQTPGRRYQVQLSGRKLTKRIVQVLVILAVIFAVMYQFSGTRMVLGELFGVPLLKHQVIYTGDQPGIRNQAYLVVENQGLSTAENVWIQVDVLGVTVTSQRTFSQVAYRAALEDLSAGVFKYEVAKLAPGASLTINLHAGQDLSDQNLVFSAVSDRGASRQLPSRVLTQPGEFPGLQDANFITRLVQFLENLPYREVWIQLLGVKIWDVLTSEYFWIAVLLSILISGIMMVFSNSIDAIATLGLCIILITFFFFPEVSVPGWLFAITFIVLMVLFIEFASISSRRLITYVERLNIPNQQLYLSILYGLFALLLLLIFIVLWNLSLPLVFVVAYTILAFLLDLLLFTRIRVRNSTFS